MKNKGGKITRTKDGINVEAGSAYVTSKKEQEAASMKYLLDELEKKQKELHELERVVIDAYCNPFKYFKLRKFIKNKYGFMINIMRINLDEE